MVPQRVYIYRLAGVCSGGQQVYIYCLVAVSPWRAGGGGVVQERGRVHLPPSPVPGHNQRTGTLLFPPVSNGTHNLFVGWPGVHPFEARWHCATFCASPPCSTTRS